MKKSHNIKGIILAVVMLLLIVGYYYYLSNRNVSQAEDADCELQTLTATQEVLIRDLETMRTIQRKKSSSSDIR